MRAPWTRRLAMSRPNSSVPSQWAALGACALARGFKRFGSWELSAGPTAAATSTSATTGPAARSWPERSRRRRQASAIADPRIQDRVAEVGEEVDGDEQGGRQEHHALDHRVVAAAQRV